MGDPALGVVRPSILTEQGANSNFDVLAARASQRTI